MAQQHANLNPHPSMGHLWRPALSVTMPPLLPPSVLVGGPPKKQSPPGIQAAEGPKCAGNILQPMPQLFPPASAYGQPRDLHVQLDIPETASDWLRSMSSLMCGCVSLLSFIGILVCLCLLLVSELVPTAVSCPSKHTACNEQHLNANPGSQKQILICLISFALCLPVSASLCQGHCICLNCCPTEAGRFIHCLSRVADCVEDCRKRLGRWFGQFRAAAPKCCRQVNKIQPSDEIAGAAQVGAAFDSVVAVPGALRSWDVGSEKPSRQRRNILDTILQRRGKARPDHWSHAHSINSDFLEFVELDPLTCEGAAVAQLVLKDPTWYCPPHVLRVVRIEHGQAWQAYSDRKHQLAAKSVWHGLEMLAQVKPPPATAQLLPQQVNNLDAGVNEQMLLLGTTQECAWLAAEHGRVPSLNDSPRRDVVSALGGGSLFCEAGFVAHEQASDAGYSAAGLDAPWAVLACRVLLARPLRHSDQAFGPRHLRDWESGRYGCIMLDEMLKGRREFLLPKEIASGAYPEYIIILQ
eukprot:TRINITY_DN12043_c0_g1_i1.p1 TRINITY_DN12043_c0_g1~~TRINITY_DN12043_c0_g1_i1.p1  ORF type:complete len:524 (+),score=84.94 TRINITY_DN12043_c0_g1_i1:92-1663(+)